MARLQKIIRMFLDPNALWRRVAALLQNPLFWIITFWGNFFVLAGASAFHYLESPGNPSIQSFLDSLEWSVAIVTTTGSSYVQPQTPLGKVLAIGMMMSGAIFIWSYMALFVDTIVNPKFRTLEREVSEIQQDVKDDEELLRRMKTLIENLERDLHRRKGNPPSSTSHQD